MSPLLKTSSRFVCALALAGPVCTVSAADTDAREVFSVAVAGGMTFSAARASEDIGMVFLHYTPSGRSALIGELERTGVLAEALGKGAAVRADLPASELQVRRRVGADGLDEYDVNGEMRLQWSRCAPGGGGCVSAGSPKKVVVSGSVVQTYMNGRPAYRVNTVRYEGGR